ncbi:MAG: hypothetical protein HY538_03390 [Deltaproteobacteria bacterium]|nr:hypothetical protein [Deltaproteobacteria bacterium]
MRLDRTIKRLQQCKRKTFTTQDLKKLLEIQQDNTAYKTAESLVRKEFLLRLRKGLFAFAFSPPEDFEVANALYSPSYISLETALNVHGILSQFPYPITSVTPRKTRKFQTLDKEFEYVHLQKGLFWGYEKKGAFLIAQPEKALMDQIYLVSKGWRKINFEELDYSGCDRKILKTMASKIAYPPFQALWKELKL